MAIDTQTHIAKADSERRFRLFHDLRTRNERRRHVARIVAEMRAERAPRTATDALSTTGRSRDPRVRSC